MKSLFVFCFIAVAPIVKAADSGYKVGDKAMDFKLKNVDGKMVSLSDYKTVKGFIVVFTCNHCPYAKAYEKRIMELNKDFAPKGYPVIAISPSDPAVEPADSYENMQKRASEKKYMFPYLIDEIQTISWTYGARNTPSAYVLQKTDSGNIVKYIGAIDNDTEDNDSEKLTYVANAVNALLENKSPSVSSTKAVGCGIKWKKDKA